MTISHSTGGNTMQPPKPVLSRAEWERTVTPMAVRQDRRLLGTKDHEYCICGTRMHEPRGGQAYCPQCRPRDDLTVTRLYPDIETGYGRDGDVPDIR